MTDRIQIIACTEDDIAPGLYCEGCFVKFRVPDADFEHEHDVAGRALAEHEKSCTAFRDWRIAQSLNLYARLDGREDEFTPEGDPL